MHPPRQQAGMMPHIALQHRSKFIDADINQKTRGVMDALLVQRAVFPAPTFCCYLRLM
jgi:hypothetical protein